VQCNAFNGGERCEERESRLSATPVLLDGVFAAAWVQYNVQEVRRTLCWGREKREIRVAWLRNGVLMLLRQSCCAPRGAGCVQHTCCTQEAAARGVLTGLTLAAFTLRVELASTSSNGDCGGRCLCPDSRTQFLIRTF